MTMKMSHPNFVRSAGLIARGVWIESLRQKDILALVVLMGLYFLSVFVIKLVGIDNPATGSFLYNLGLTLTCYVAHAMALLSAGRQVPDEIENRTIYPILAKPITRSAFIAGKWFAATSFGWVSALALLTLVYIFAPQMESYSSLLGFQALTLMSLSLGALSAWAILLSMVTPKPVVYLLLGGWFVVGDKILTIIQSSLDASWIKEFLLWVFEYTPNFSRWNLWTRYTDGVGPLSAMDWGAALMQALLFIAIAWLVSDFIFRRKPL